MVQKMRKMKDSGIEWIGEIPEGWEVSQLKYATRWKSEKGCPDAPVLSLYRDFGVVPKDSRNDNHNVTSLDTSNYKVVDIGDLVINKMKAWQGSMAVSDYRGIVSPAYHVCSITSNKVNKRYLHHLLRNPAYLPEYVRLSTGMRIGQWDLGFDDFKNIPFLIPPFDEQAKIADYLDNGCTYLDSILDKTHSSIEEYKKLKRAGLDYWKYLDVTTYPSLENFMERHKDEQEKMYYFTTKAQHIYTEVQYPDGCWLLFGREDAGLPEELLVQHPARCLRFPMRQGLRSLNLSNSVAIGVYEALRQWDFPQLQNEGQLHRLKWE